MKKVFKHFLLKCSRCPDKVGVSCWVPSAPPVLQNFTHEAVYFFKKGYNIWSRKETMGNTDPKTGRFIEGGKPFNAGLHYFHNPDTGEKICAPESPGEGWLPGFPSHFPPPTHKGKKWFHNPKTGETKRDFSSPGSDWKEGRGNSVPQFTNKGLSWFFNSETGEEKMFSSLPGGVWTEGRAPFEVGIWREKTSRHNCQMWNCDHIYVLKITTEDGVTFGKWGSTKEKTFQFREKEFLRHKFTFEVFFFDFFGESTEDAEAFIGRKLSKFPVKEIPKFYGFTETFEWTEQTQQILEETINALEESAPSDW